MLSNQYNAICNELVTDFTTRVVALSDDVLLNKKYSLFYPIIGKEYYISRDLLVIGQATNGWHNAWTTKKIASIKIDSIIKEAINYSQPEKDDCPLNWVNTNWSKSGLYRSFFWNVIYKLIISQYKRTDGNWNEIMVWSNLIKIAPHDFGNPDIIEKEIQFKIASQLFEREIIDLQPKNVILFTNFKGWAEPVFDFLNIKFEKPNSDKVEAQALYYDSNIIVVKRPYLANHMNYVNEIQKFLKD
jgi:hypothetical protein